MNGILKTPYVLIHVMLLMVELVLYLFSLIKFGGGIPIGPLLLRKSGMYSIVTEKSSCLRCLKRAALLRLPGVSLVILFFYIPIVFLSMMMMETVSTEDQGRICRV